MNKQTVTIVLRTSFVKCVAAERSGAMRKRRTKERVRQYIGFCGEKQVKHKML